MLTSPLLARAQLGAAAKVAILTDLVKAIGAAGDALSKLTAGFTDLIVAGKDSYEYVAAQRERTRLIDISRRTAGLISSQSEVLVPSLDFYIAKASTPVGATDADWSNVVRYIGDTLVAVQALLVDVQKEDGAFVLEPAFLELNKVLKSRSLLLEQLASMSAPRTKEELALLEQASAKYKVLIANAGRAVSQLNIYVKEKK